MKNLYLAPDAPSVLASKIAASIKECHRKIASKNTPKSPKARCGCTHDFGVGSGANTNNHLVQLYLSGGRSPIDFLAQLSRAELDWEQIAVRLVDERCVQSDHPASNARLLRENLLQNAAQKARFIPLVNDEYLNEPEKLLQHANQMRADCDICVLGMGLDGHFASIFSDAPASALDKCAKPKYFLAPREDFLRISLNVSAMLCAKYIFLYIAGAAKLEVLKSAKERNLPIAAVLERCEIYIKE